MRSDVLGTTSKITRSFALGNNSLLPSTFLQLPPPSPQDLKKKVHPPPTYSRVVRDLDIEEQSVLRSSLVHPLRKQSIPWRWSRPIAEACSSINSVAVPPASSCILGNADQNAFGHRAELVGVDRPVKSTRQLKIPIGYQNQNQTPN